MNYCSEFNCQNPTTKKCGKCMSTFYCSREYQRSIKKEHKANFKEFSYFYELDYIGK